MMDNKSYKACPNCTRPIPRKSFKKEVFKCLNCGRVVCSDCSINFSCIDCYVKLRWKTETSHYFGDLYSQAS